MVYYAGMCNKNKLFHLNNLLRKLQLLSCISKEKTLENFKVMWQVPSAFLPMKPITVSVLFIKKPLVD